MSGPLTMRLLWLWVLTREVQNTKWYSTWPSEFLKPNLRFQGSFAYSAKIISYPIPNWIEMGHRHSLYVSNRNTGNTKNEGRWISILNSLKCSEKQIVSWTLICFNQRWCIFCKTISCHFERNLKFAFIPPLSNLHQGLCQVESIGDGRLAPQLDCIVVKPG